MTALLSNMPRKRTISGIFLFWVLAIGTFEIKQYANEKNYGHCIGRDAFSLGYVDWLSLNRSDQIDPIDKKQIKAISRRYNIPQKKVETRLESYRKRRNSIRLVSDKSRRLTMRSLANSKFYTKQYLPSLQVMPKQKEPTIKQKASRYFESTIGFIVGGYFKIMGISFLPKPCKRDAKDDV